MIYVLAYPEFDPDTAAEIDRFRAAHEPERAKMVPPHITLVFGLRFVTASEFLPHCENVARRLPEMVITFGQTELAHDPHEGTYKLFLTCEAGQAALVAAHGQLYAGPQRDEFDASTPYRPHMTVATHPDRARIQQLDISTLGSFPIYASLNALSVVEVAEGGLTLLKRFPFSG